MCRCFFFQGKTGGGVGLFARLPGCLLARLLARLLASPHLQQAAVRVFFWVFGPFRFKHDVACFYFRDVRRQTTQTGST